MASTAGDTTNNGGSSSVQQPRWKQRLSWGRASAGDETSAAAAATTTASALSAPSWTNASSPAPTNSREDYGVPDHLPRQRLSWDSVRGNLATASMNLRRRASSSSSHSFAAKEHEALRLEAQTRHLAFYQDLLDHTKPSTITLVVRRRPSSEANIAKASGDGYQSHSQMIKNLLGVRLAKSPESNHRFLVVPDDDSAAEEEGEFESSHTTPPRAPPPPLVPSELAQSLTPGDYFLDSVDGKAVGGRQRRVSLNSKNRCWDEEGLCKALRYNNNSQPPALSSVREGSPQDDKSNSDDGGDHPTTEDRRAAYHTTTLTFVRVGGATANHTPAPPKEEPTEDSPEATSGAPSSPAPKEEDASSETAEASATPSSPQHSSPTKPEAAVAGAAGAAKVPTLHKVYFVDPQPNGDDDDNDPETALEDFLGLETAEKPVVLANPTPAGTRFSFARRTLPPDHEFHRVATSLLHVGDLPETNHWLEHQTQVKEGDVLLSVNDTPCFNGELSPGDLSLVWKTALLTSVLSSANEPSSAKSSPPPYLSITTCRLPPTLLQQVKKTAVAATGGALVGTGAVLMVTPLHPVGHAMALGGLGVLGTEFEAPKQAFRQAKASAVQLADRVKNSRRQRASSQATAAESTTTMEEPTDPTTQGSGQTESTVQAAP